MDKDELIRRISERWGEDVEHLLEILEIGIEDVALWLVEEYEDVVNYRLEELDIV